MARTPTSLRSAEELEELGEGGEEDGLGVGERGAGQLDLVAHRQQRHVLAQLQQSLDHVPG